MPQRVLHPFLLCGHRRFDAPAEDLGIRDGTESQMVAEAEQHPLAAKQVAAFRGDPLHLRRSDT
jgi:hypothetical protein